MVYSKLSPSFVSGLKRGLMSNKEIIVALDFDSPMPALELVDKLDPDLCRVKVGKELFTASGPGLVQEIISRKFDVFLDLKFHDIPNTVANSVKVAADLGVWMVNVHTSGGAMMMESAKEALSSYGGESPLLVGVTVLTSLTKQDLMLIGIEKNLQEQVLSLALLAKNSGLDGVVCSAEETKKLRSIIPRDFCLVTPGIRRPEDPRNDQKRTVGPREAMLNGSDYLVVGRPITLADSPASMLSEFNLAIAP